MKAAGLGPPKTEAEAAAERTAAEFAASNRAAASKSAFERVAAEKAAADKVFAERAVAAEKVAAERAAADRARAERDRAERAEREMQQASKTMRSALAALEFGQLAGSAEEREQLRAAIERARTYGVEATKVAKAEDQFRLTVAKAEAAVAAERAIREAAEAAERAAAEQAIREEREREERAVLMQEAREILRRSVSRPSDERKKILRDLQVKWHPDKFANGNDEKAKEFAAELSQKANEAARIAKMQAKEAAAKQRRMAAYGKLQGMSSLSVEQLSAAIEEARAAGVSDMEIFKAENKLKGIARAGDPQGAAMKAAAVEAEAQAAEAQS